MNDNEELSVTDLLIPPTFKREQYTAFLFAPYSRKLRRRVYLYTEKSYNLWVRLESDPSVATFNERIRKIPMSPAAGRVVFASPAAVSVATDNTVTIHTFDPVCEGKAGEAESEDPLPPWNAWTSDRGYRHIAWTPEALHGNRTELENLKKLLRYVANAGAGQNFLLEQRIVAELKSVRKMAVVALARRFPESDSEEIMRAIASLIVDQVIFSDIASRPYDILSEVSAYRDVREI